MHNPSYEFFQGKTMTSQHNSLPQISNCNLKRLDSRILNLKQLVHLDMSDNRLTCVPAQLRELGALSSLILSNNVICEFSTELCTSTSHLCGNLRTLDLSGQSI